MRVLIITYHFPPDGAIGAVRPYQFARLLPQHGIEPWVLTVQPQFAETLDNASVIEGIPHDRIIRTLVQPTKRQRVVRFASALKRKAKAAKSSSKPTNSLEHETQQRVDVGWLASSKSGKLLGRWLFHPDRLWGWRRPGLAAGEELISRVKFDVILSTSPPITGHLIGARLAARHRIPWVMDLRDPWLDDGNIPSITLDYLQQRLFIRGLKQAGAVVLNTRRFENYVNTHYSTAAAKTFAIPNGAILPSEAQPPVEPTERRFSIGHYGNVYGLRSSETFLRGVKLWMEREKNDAVSAIVNFRGHETGDAAQWSAKLGLESTVNLLPAVSRLELDGFMAQEYIFLLLANKWEMQIPGKLYEYLAHHRRILAVADEEGATADLLRARPGCAVASSPDDVVAALEMFWKEFEKGRDARVDHEEFLKECSYTRRTAQLAGVLKSLAGLHG